MQEARSSPYYKKTLTLHTGRSPVNLMVAHDLFSSQAVDAGSRMLLRSLMEETDPESILDVGCGYGPLGLGLKARYPAARVDMIDRDALAVQFASGNAALNRMPDVATYGSVGYDGIDPDRRFALVVCNVPGKAGNPVIEDLLIGAADLLQKGGKVAVVVVSALLDEVSRVLQQAEADVLFRQVSKAHAVFQYSLGSRSDAGRSVLPNAYERHRARFSRASISWDAVSVWGLPEFDSLSFQTALVIDRIVKSQPKRPRTLVLNPGQGHVPVAIALQSKPRKIVLVGRDLLALQTSLANLSRNDFSTDRVRLHHDAGFDVRGGPFDLVVAALPDKLSTGIIAETVSSLAAHVAGGGSLILGGRSTAVTRVLGSNVLDGFELRERSRSHGFTAARLRK